MRFLLATVFGISAASAGFTAGLVAAVVFGPWIAMAGAHGVRGYSAIGMGEVIGLIAMFLTFAVVGFQNKGSCRETGRGFRFGLSSKTVRPLSDGEMVRSC